MGEKERENLFRKCIQEQPSIPQPSKASQSHNSHPSIVLGIFNIKVGYLFVFSLAHQFPVSLVEWYQIQNKHLTSYDDDDDDDDMK